MSDEVKTPDALYVPHRLAADPDVFVRGARLNAIAREHLKLPDGPPPVISPYELQGDLLVHFVRRTVADTKLFPTSHLRAGETRHEWIDGPDGIRYGYAKGD